MEQVDQLPLFGAGQVAEDRRFRDRRDEALTRLDAGWCQRQRLHTAVLVVARAGDEAPLLEAIGEEGDVGRVAAQPLGQRASGHWADRRVQLPERVGERHGEVERFEGVVQVRLERRVQRVGGLRELVCRWARFGHAGIVRIGEDFTRC